MGTTLNWKLREHQHRFRSEPGTGREIRFNILINLILHANGRGRTWVSRDRIAAEIGAGEGRVSAALTWLFEKGAIYNVPLQYRVGAERCLEPRKYVFQLTGIIRFDEGPAVPYLYIPDLEQEIASTLRELEDIGGEGLVAFLTQGSETEHSETSPGKGADSAPLKSSPSERSDSDHLKSSLFGQRSASDRSHSDRSVSDHKDVTESKDSTIKPSISDELPLADVGEYNPYVQKSPAAAKDTRPRTGEKTVVETPKGDKVVAGQEEYTDFEKWLMATTRKKELSQRQRDAFNEVAYYVPDNESGETVESPTVNQAWDKSKGYRSFVAECILPDIKSKNLVHVTGFDKFLNSATSWKRYAAWDKVHGHEHGTPRRADQQLIEMPDGKVYTYPADISTQEAIDRWAEEHDK
jgi:hypothetical protein